MASPLEADLLGPPSLRCSGQSFGHVRRKTVALVAYLALNPRPHSRGAPAALLWPSRGQSAARANPRRALSTLRRPTGQELVVSEQDTVQLRREHVRTDVQRFLDLARACVDHRPEEAWERCLSRLRRAEAVYRNDLLFGFPLPGCTEFDHWQFLEGEQLRTALASALRRPAVPGVPAPPGAGAGRGARSRNPGPPRGAAVRQARRARQGRSADGTPRGRSRPRSTGACKSAWSPSA